ncbi:MAG: membrane protein insertion efficiency factor YidD [Planctomycetota bacterium]
MTAAPRRAWRRIVAAPSAVLAWLLVLAVRAYQRLVSPWMGSNCRFTPTCSEYFIRAVQKYGPLEGGRRGVLRVCRCHPWHPGGHDPP